MAGLFGNPSDAGRGARGPRPFAGQSHEPGTGPIKAHRVRRNTVAPFESPLAERRRMREDPPRAPGLGADAAWSASTASESDPAAAPIVSHERLPGALQLDATTDRSISPPSVLQVDDLRGAGTTDPVDGEIERAAPHDDDDWFAAADAGSIEPAPDEAPDELSNGALLAGWSHLASGDPEAEPPPPSEPRPVEADLVAGVEMIRTRERIAVAIEAVARRVRSGEIVVALEPGASSEAVLASTLASLLTSSTR